MGVNNYVNKVSLQRLLRSPELLTSLGAIENTPLDFHSGKLGRYDKQSELEELGGQKLVNFKHLNDTNASAACSAANNSCVCPWCKCACDGGL